MKPFKSSKDNYCCCPKAQCPRRSMILGAYNAACLLTLTGAGAAIAAIVLASSGKIELALIGLMLAGLADLFDGVVARRLALNNYEKEYGVQLDTVVDVIAFVATPIVIALNSGQRSVFAPTA